MKTDARVRYTQMILKHSLLKLLMNKPIHKVTVREICELSELNRATFYSHFKDAFDLLAHIEADLYREVEIALKDGGKTGVDDMVRGALSAISNNAEVCAVLFSENGDKQFIHDLSSMAREQSFRDWRRRFPGTSDERLALAYTFIVNGSLAIIESWVKSGMRTGPQEIGRFVSAIADKALAVLKECRP